LIKGSIDIVLVEDSDADIELTLHAMHKESAVRNVKVLRDGEEALEYFFGTELTKLPALIVLDLKLPKVNGLEVLRKLKSNLRTKSIPVVILTSSKEERDLTESYQLGVNSYIQKPLDFDAFRGAIKQLTEYWLRTNAGPPMIH
jgi:two-component system, response regulator